MVVNMDTIHLLEECDAGSKMAVASIDEVLECTHNSNLKDLLRENKSYHEKLGNELHAQLLKHHQEDKDPHPMAKGMSWVKTHMKLGMDGSDQTIADLITDGCDMGIKSLHKYLNQYQNADVSSKEICQQLITLEENLRTNLTAYL